MTPHLEWAGGSAPAAAENHDRLAAGPGGQHATVTDTVIAVVR